MTTITVNNKTLDLSVPQVMGILNVTPDSFSDGGHYTHIDAALAQAHQMLADGATILDIGGESTRPGAEAVSEAVELERVIPLIQAIRKHSDCWISVDTSKAAVMTAAIAAGADLINDVCALQNQGCLEAVAASHLPVCLMHMQGSPRTMQLNPEYGDVVVDVKAFFQSRIEACISVGIERDRIILDPGFGFGKTLEQNYQMLARMTEFADLGLPILSGTSRKSMIGNLLNRNVDERLAGSLATAIIAAQNGASIIRVHDVKETVDALAVLAAAQ